jgi:hypothetical protein
VEPLPAHSSGELTCACLKKGLSWAECVDICNDPWLARRMVCHCTNSTSSRSCCEKVPDVRRVMLGEAVRIVNFIKWRPWNSRIFSALCDVMGSSYTCTQRFGVCHEAECRFVQSDCSKKFWYSVLTVPFSLRYVCVAQEGSIPSRHFCKDKLTIFIILRHDYRRYLDTC